MKIEMLVQAKDMLENMLIKVQDDTIDRLLLNKTMQYDNCKECNCKKKWSLNILLMRSLTLQICLIVVLLIWTISFLTMLDSAREDSGIPYKITSGYRTEGHNQKVGGVKDSSHRKGRAADIAIKDSRERWIITSSLIKAGFNRIGIAKTFIHVDNDSNKNDQVIWVY